ncbi:hypothetical protein EGH21_08065 [Halomicroarcula sp. F13]|uniref:Halobacterial output domain-containing protein n=1 Tax=Haloarcula rubra TaxID=2487747 RepID=A0AAW4PQJ0_9EURY|nr:HalOD1 output domain-containing protein [Halomicroarcula rubra]MBX0322981.1 hypothetical protein [Halomicroarcula rubra]
MTSGHLSISCACVAVHEAEYSGDSERPPSVAVVEAVAAAEGVEPTELRSLSADIDLEAVDALFENDDTTGQAHVLSYTVAGWNVFVRGDGAIRVCDPTQTGEPTPTFEQACCD